MKKRVVIIQEYNTPYRNELFNRVAAYEDIDLTLLYVGGRGTNRKWTDPLVTRFREVQVACCVRQVDYERTRTALNYLDLARKVLALKPDVVVSQLGKVTILLHYLLLWKQAALIHWSEATMATEGGINWYSRPYLKAHLGLPAAFLVPGSLARDYLEYCGFDVSGRLFYAPNSVDERYSISAEKLAAKFSGTAPLRFLFIGSFVERKGFHLVKEVCARLLADGYTFELHVAGAGPIGPCAEMVHHGFVSQEAALELYLGSNVFLMPSQYDCNPLSLIEAAKTGNVLIASRGVGNYPELIDGNGFVAEPESAESLYRQCVAVLELDRTQLRGMAERSVELGGGISHEATAAAFHSAVNFVTSRRTVAKKRQVASP